MTTNDPTLIELTLTEARAGLRRGDFGCVEYVGALLARADAAAHLNALIATDREALLAAATAVDASGAARGPAGATRAAGAAGAADDPAPLAGIPIALKDNIDTADLPTTAATGALQGRRPRRNAPVAQALFDAGALLAGKANLHELAFGITTHNAVTGATRNPYDPAMIPGGSSGGSAVAVAARMVPAAIGTDTGASVRLPAALCGVVGFRPTVGRYPQRGIVPISHTRDTPGPMARSVADIVLLDRVMAGLHGLHGSRGSGDPGASRASTRATPDASAPVALRGLRIGLPLRYFHAGLDPTVAAVVDASLARLRAAGVDLVEAEVIDLAELNAAVGFPVVLHELQHDLPAYLAEAGYDLTLAELVAGVGSPDVAGILGSQLGADAMPRAAYEAAMAVRPRLQAAYADYFAAHRLDAMLFPTAILPARPIGDDETVLLNGERVPTFMTFIRNTDPGSNAGIPGISLPAGLTSDGLPVGLELDGPIGRDERLLAVAAAIAEALPPTPPPDIASTVRPRSLP